MESSKRVNFFYVTHNFFFISRMTVIHDEHHNGLHTSNHISLLNYHYLAYIDFSFFFFFISVLSGRPSTITVMSEVLYTYTRV